MKELLRDAVSVMETWWARFPQDMSASDRDVLTRMQAEIDAQEPYDQQALELCDVCGWKTLIPGDCCLNCTRPNPEPVKFEFRWTNPDGLPDVLGGMLRWKPIEESTYSPEELMQFRFKGKPCYEVRALYTKSQPVADLTDAEIKALVEKCADDQWPDVGYVGWSVIDTEFYARLIKAVLAAQKAKA